MSNTTTKTTDFTISLTFTIAQLYAENHLEKTYNEFYIFTRKQ